MTLCAALRSADYLSLSWGFLLICTPKLMEPEKSDECVVHVFFLQTMISSEADCAKSCFELCSHPQNWSSSQLPLSSSVWPPSRQTAPECDMGPNSRAGAPTVRAPAIEPSWQYWIKHPVMYEAGAAPEGAELPHLLPPLCAYDLLSKLCSY